tara:strand:+ start:2372 stop:2674 length:303 start_codon:yes stop_codon:yes gene_type:complete
MSNYSKTSPYYKTELSNGDYLDLYYKRSIPADSDDILYEIQPQYTYRPDLLAYDLYGSSKLWWVFAVRNMDIIKDPVFDFIPGNKIFLPKKSLLSSIIGL